MHQVIRTVNVKHVKQFIVEGHPINTIDPNSCGHCNVYPCFSILICSIYIIYIS
jgi:hypothetical protein